jgi:hypothetical protein
MHKTWQAVLCCAATLALALPPAGDAWARGRHSGARPAGSAPHWRGPHHSHFRASTTFLFAGPAFFFGAPAYYYAPLYPGEPAPTIYIERYDGTPQPGSAEHFLCPSSGESYPEAAECPGGWARVIDNPAPPPGPQG